MQCLLEEVAAAQSSLPALKSGIIPFSYGTQMRATTHFAHLILACLLAFSSIVGGMAKYSGAVEFIPQDAFAGCSFSEPLIEKVAAAYGYNTLRIQSLGRLPILLTGVSWVQATFDMVARHELELSHNDPRIDPDAVLFDPELLIQKELVRMDLQGEWFERSKKKGARTGMDIGEDRLAYFTSDGNAELTEGLSAVHIGMITGMWTSFEVMAGDLWEAAVNLSPGHLSGLHGGKRSESKTDKQADKILELRLIHEFLYKNDFNLSKVMGTLHRKSGRFRFTTLDGTRDAYMAAFHKDAEKVLEAINDASLDSLAAVRHVLVHSAGKPDSMFLAAAKKHGGLAKWKSLGYDDTLEFVGSDVRGLIAPVFDIGLKLLVSVDNWIQAHKQ